MTPRKPRAPSEADAPPVATGGYDAVPSSPHADHSFTLQAIMELQKSTGKLEAAIEANTAALTKLDAKIDKTTDRLETRIATLESKVSAISHKVYAAVTVGGFILAGIGAALRFWPK
jgi:hypothetical protein